jgi:hypothetical protein
MNTPSTDESIEEWLMRKLFKSSTSLAALTRRILLFHATPYIRKFGTNFADKRRSLDRYSSVADWSHGVLVHNISMTIIHKLATVKHKVQMKQKRQKWLPISSYDHPGCICSRTFSRNFEEFPSNHTTGAVAHDLNIKKYNSQLSFFRYT